VRSRGTEGEKEMEREQKRRERLREREGEKERETLIFLTQDTITGQQHTLGE